MIAFLIIAALAGQSTTTCRNYGGTIQCNTQPSVNTPAPPLDYGLLTRSQPSPVQSYQQGVALGQAIREQRAEHEARERGKIAGRMIAEGNCEGAKRYALELGDFALVQAVKQNCE